MQPTAKRAHKLWMVLTMFLAIGVFAVMSPAQDQNGQTPDQQQQAQPGQSGQAGQMQGQAGQAQGQQGNQVTATGCLQKSGSDTYTLTDQANNQSYTLTSSNVDLSAHVGHEVKVTGTSSSATASNPNASSAQPSGQSSAGNQTLDVSSLEMISSSCGANGNNGSSTGATTPPQK